MPQHYLGSSLPRSWSMPSAREHRASTFTPDRTTGCFISHASSPKQKYTRLSTETCCLRMLPLSQPPHKRSSRPWWFASLKTAGTLRWLKKDKRSRTWCRRDQESSNHIRSPHHTSVGELKALCQDKDDSLQCLRHKHTSPRWRAMDNIFQAGKETEHFSLAVYPPHTGHVVEGQSVQYWSSVSHRPNNHVHSAQTAQASIAGHVCRIEDCRIPKDIVYRELANGKKDTGSPQLRYRDVCKRNMKVLAINSDHWEDLVGDRTGWRSSLTKQLMPGDDKLNNAAEDKLTRWK